MNLDHRNREWRTVGRVFINLAVGWRMKERVERGIDRRLFQFLGREMRCQTRERVKGMIRSGQISFPTSGAYDSVIFSPATLPPS